MGMNLWRRGQRMCAPGAVRAIVAARELRQEQSALKTGVMPAVLRAAAAVTVPAHQTSLLLTLTQSPTTSENEAKGLLQRGGRPQQNGAVLVLHLRQQQSPAAEASRARAGVLEGRPRQSRGKAQGYQKGGPE